MKTVLNIRTKYTLQDGAANVEDMIRELARLDVSIAGIADDCLSGAPEFCFLCLKHGIKPLIGATVNGRILYAENDEGYRSLCRILSGKNELSEGSIAGLSESPETRIGYYATRADKDLRFSLCQKDDGYLLSEMVSDIEYGLEFTFKFEYKKTVLPKFTIFGIKDNFEYLRQGVFAGLRNIYGQDKDGYTRAEERALFELDIIKQTGFTDYYLITADFVSYAKGRGIAVGPGRGSGAGSICAYALGITEVDPIEYGLYFERFLNPERASSPDFDIDFDSERRAEVIEYVAEKYGRDKVGAIVTFGTYGVRGTGRLSELPSNRSRHAAGIVITPEPLINYAPLRYNEDGFAVIDYTYEWCERLGLLKIDFLGLKYLTEAVKAAKRLGIKLSEIPTDDEAAFALLCSADTKGVFQMESGGVQDLLKRLKPRNIADIAAVTALYRPGPMANIGRYLYGRENPEKITYAHPILIPILSETNGVFVYQEQVMRVFREMAGYSLGNADIVRRAMAKKRRRDIELERAVFISGAAERGVDEVVAANIFEEMSAFAEYAFNKSHAVCYAVLAYKTAYLKARNWGLKTENRQGTLFETIALPSLAAITESMNAAPKKIYLRIQDFSEAHYALITDAATRNPGGDTLLIYIPNKNETRVFPQKVRISEGLALEMSGYFGGDNIKIKA